MKPFSLFATIASSALLAMTSLDASASSISDYTWHNRLLIVFAREPASPELANQRALIDEAKAGFAERDLVPIEVIGDTTRGTRDSAASLRQRYGVAAGAFRVLLIGKDGGVKIDSAEPIGPQRLFGTIDAMPMRRDEMSRAPKS